MPKQTCKCGYTWESRVAEPKACPECKTRMGPQRRNKDAEKTLKRIQKNQNNWRAR